MNELVFTRYIINLDELEYLTFDVIKDELAKRHFIQEENNIHGDFQSALNYIKPYIENLEIAKQNLDNLTDEKEFLTTKNIDKNKNIINKVGYLVSGKIYHYLTSTPS